MKLLKLMYLLPIFTWPNIGYAEKDLNYTVPFHQPISVKYRGQESTLIFLKNNLKKELPSDEGNISDGEFFNVTDQGKSIDYIDRVKGDEILSVFFYLDKKKDSKFLYILTGTKISQKNKKGYLYSTSKYLITLKNDIIHISHDSNDKNNIAINNCFEGLDGDNKVICKYKNASAIKKYLNSSD
ncbi:hypothetical protein [Pragia fontium]|uniref:hypothetical protein n=1 Tax=Pragia fontium TaxID=82985 RepID=UPI00064AAC2F|nr:hypothetical protein [Pragia fontium]AKJ42908.1 hypothetical protein QQ39_13225 [Pragia fontium]